VQALHQPKTRGNFLPLDQTRQQRFAEKTDRVRMFLAERTRPGDRSRRCIKKSDLYLMFLNWLEVENPWRKSGMKKTHFNERVRLADVEEFTPKGWTKCWNLIPYDDETADQTPSETTDPTNLSDKPSLIVSGGDNNESQVGVSEGRSEIETTDPHNDCAAEEVILQGELLSAKSAVLPLCLPSTEKSQKQQIPAQCIETTETTDLEPYRGSAPTGIVYISQEEDLPDLGLLPKSIGFDLETFNRRSDLWRHKAA